MHGCQKMKAGVRIEKNRIKSDLNFRVRRLGLKLGFDEENSIHATLLRVLLKPFLENMFSLPGFFKLMNGQRREMIGFLKVQTNIRTISQGPRECGKRFASLIS